MASLRIARLIVYPVREKIIKKRDDKRKRKRTRTETSAIFNGLRLFGLQANVKFKIVNMTVEALGSLRNLRFGIPFREIRVSCRTRVGMNEVNRENRYSPLRPKNYSEN
jgi:hypothetical protein